MKSTKEETTSAQKNAVKTTLVFSIAALVIIVSLTIAYCTGYFNGISQ